MTSGHFYWNKETIEELLSKEEVTPEEINREDAEGNTPLKKAIRMHDIPALKQLLAKEGIKVNKYTGQDSALNLAVDLNDPDAVESLLQSKKVSVNAGTGNFEVTALECAISINCRDYTGAHSRDKENSRNLIITRLLDEGASHSLSLVKIADGKIIIDAKNTLYRILSCSSTSEGWGSLVKTFIEHPKVSIKTVRAMHDKIYNGASSPWMYMINEEEAKPSRIGDDGFKHVARVRNIVTMCPPTTEVSTDDAARSNAGESAPFCGAGGPGTRISPLASAALVDATETPVISGEAVEPRRSFAASVLSTTTTTTQPRTWRDIASIASNFTGCVIS